MTDQPSETDSITQQDFRFGLVSIFHRNEFPQLTFKVTHTAATQEEFARLSLFASKRAQLSHPNLLSCYEHTVDPEKKAVSMVFEYPNSDIVSRKSELTVPQEQIKFLYEMLSALHFLNTNGFPHSDVRPEQIFYNKLERKYVLVDQLANLNGNASRQLTHIQQRIELYTEPHIFEAIVNERDLPVIDQERVQTFSLGLSLIEVACGDGSIQVFYDIENKKFFAEDFTVFLEDLEEQYKEQGFEALGKFIVRDVINYSSEGAQSIPVLLAKMSTRFLQELAVIKGEAQQRLNGPIAEAVGVEGSQSLDRDNSLEEQSVKMSLEMRKSNDSNMQRRLMKIEEQKKNHSGEYGKSPERKLTDSVDQSQPNNPFASAESDSKKIENIDLFAEYDRKVETAGVKQSGDDPSLAHVNQSISFRQKSEKSFDSLRNSMPTVERTPLKPVEDPVPTPDRALLPNPIAPAPASADVLVAQPVQTTQTNAEQEQAAELRHTRDSEQSALNTNNSITSQGEVPGDKESLDTQRDLNAFAQGIKKQSFQKDGTMQKIVEIVQDNNGSVLDKIKETLEFRKSEPVEKQSIEAAERSPAASAEEAKMASYLQTVAQVVQENNDTVFSKLKTTLERLARDPEISQSSKKILSERIISSITKPASPENQVQDQSHAEHQPQSMKISSKRSVELRKVVELAMLNGEEVLSNTKNTLERMNELPPQPHSSKKLITIDPPDISSLSGVNGGQVQKVAAIGDAKLGATDGGNVKNSIDKIPKISSIKNAEVGSARSNQVKNSLGGGTRTSPIELSGSTKFVDSGVPKPPSAKTSEVGQRIEQGVRGSVEKNGDLPPIEVSGSTKFVDSGLPHPPSAKTSEVGQRTSHGTKNLPQKNEEISPIEVSGSTKFVDSGLPHPPSAKTSEVGQRTDHGGKVLLEKKEDLPPIEVSGSTKFIDVGLPQPSSPKTSEVGKRTSDPTRKSLEKKEELPHIQLSGSTKFIDSGVPHPASARNSEVGSKRNLHGVPDSTLAIPPLEISQSTRFIDCGVSRPLSYKHLDDVLMICSKPEANAGQAKSDEPEQVSAEWQKAMENKEKEAAVEDELRSRASIEVQRSVDGGSAKQVQMGKSISSKQNFEEPMFGAKSTDAQNDNLQDADFNQLQPRTMIFDQDLQEKASLSFSKRVQFEGNNIGSTPEIKKFAEAEGQTIPPSPLDPLGTQRKSTIKSETQIEHPPHDTHAHPPPHHSGTAAPKTENPEKPRISGSNKDIIAPGKKETTSTNAQYEEIAEKIIKKDVEEDKSLLPGGSERGDDAMSQLAKQELQAEVDKAALDVRAASRSIPVELLVNPVQAPATGQLKTFDAALLNSHETVPPTAAASNEALSEALNPASHQSSSLTSGDPSKITTSTVPQELSTAPKEKSSADPMYSITKSQPPREEPQTSDQALDPALSLTPNSVIVFPERKSVDRQPFFHQKSSLSRNSHVNLDDLDFDRKNSFPEKPPGDGNENDPVFNMNASCSARKRSFMVLSSVTSNRILMNQNEIHPIQEEPSENVKRTSVTESTDPLPQSSNKAVENCQQKESCCSEEKGAHGRIDFVEVQLYGKRELNHGVIASLAKKTISTSVEKVKRDLLAQQKNSDAPEVTAATSKFPFSPKKLSPDGCDGPLIQSGLVNEREGVLRDKHDIAIQTEKSFMVKQALATDQPCSQPQILFTDQEIASQSSKSKKLHHTCQSKLNLSIRSIDALSKMSQRSKRKILDVPTAQTPHSVQEKQHPGGLVTSQILPSSYTNSQTSAAPVVGNITRIYHKLDNKQIVEVSQTAQSYQFVRSSIFVNQETIKSLGNITTRPNQYFDPVNRESTLYKTESCVPQSRVVTEAATWKAPSSDQRSAHRYTVKTTVLPGLH